MLEKNIRLIECYLDSMIKAALLGKIKDAACIDMHATAKNVYSVHFCMHARVMPISMHVTFSKLHII